MCLLRISLDMGGPNLWLKQSDSQELLSEEILCGRETSGNHLHSKSHKTDFFVRKKWCFWKLLGTWKEILVTHTC